MNNDSSENGLGRNAVRPSTEKSGSACSSGAVTPSHVLTEMGVPDEVAGPTVRLSLGRETTAEQIDKVIVAFPAVVERMRALAVFEAD